MDGSSDIILPYTRIDLGVAVGIGPPVRDVEDLKGVEFLFFTPDKVPNTYSIHSDHNIGRALLDVNSRVVEVTLITLETDFQKRGIGTAFCNWLEARAESTGRRLAFDGRKLEPGRIFWEKRRSKRVMEPAAR